jgi:hypothetical protein
MRLKEGTAVPLPDTGISVLDPSTITVITTLGSSAGKNPENEPT